MSISFDQVWPRSALIVATTCCPFSPSRPGPVVIVQSQLPSLVTTT